MTFSVRLVPALLGLLLVATVPAAPPPVAAVEPAPAAAPYDVKPFRERPSDDDRLERAWAVWQARRDHPTYTVLVERQCFCQPRRRVVTKVVGQRVVSVTREGGARQLGRAGDEVPRLYRLLRRAYAAGDDVQVGYRRGVPIGIIIDPGPVTDDEIVLGVTVRVPPHAARMSR